MLNIFNFFNPFKQVGSFVIQCKNWCYCKDQSRCGNSFDGTNEIVNENDKNDKNDKNKKRLYCAAKKGKLEDVKKLCLEQQVNHDFHHGKKRNTPLHAAVKNGHVKVIKILLASGEQKNIENKRGETPLHTAIQFCSNTEICKIIIDLLLDKKDKDHHQQYDEAKYDKENHRRSNLINYKNKIGQTPLHIAVKLGRAEICLLLLENGAEVNAKDHEGNTPLHYASQTKQMEIYNLLRNHGAEEIKNKKGKTPFQLCKKFAKDYNIKKAETFVWFAKTFTILTTLITVLCIMTEITLSIGYTVFKKIDLTLDETTQIIVDRIHLIAITLAICCGAIAFFSCLSWVYSNYQLENEIKQAIEDVKIIARN